MLAWLNYRGVLMTLNVNFVITALAYALDRHPVLLGAAVEPGRGAEARRTGHAAERPALWLDRRHRRASSSASGIYLGIEGTTQAAEEVRSPARSLPYGTMAGMITLLIAAALTWYVCAGLLPWEYLGITFYPALGRRAR